MRSLKFGISLLAISIATAAKAQTYPNPTVANITDRGVTAGKLLLSGGTAGPITGSLVGNGVLNALGVNIGVAGAPVLFNGAGGTPSSIDLTNATNVPSGALTGTLAAGRLPALTGDATSSAGSAATTVGAIGGKAVTLGAALTSTGAGATTLAFGASTQTYTFPTVSATLAQLGAQTFTGAQAINLNAVAAPTPVAGTVLQIGGADASAAFIETNTFGGTPIYTGRRADGTGASPTAVQLGDILVGFSARPFDGSAYSSSSVANVQAVAAENFTTSAHGANIAFNCTAPTSLTTAQCGLLTSTGFQGAIGATTPNTSKFTTTAIGGATIGTDALGVTGTTTHNGDVTVAGAALILSGNQSKAAWTTNGLRLKGVAGTLTDTTSSGTVAAGYTDVLGGNTIAASSATTFTKYASLHLNAPVAGSNVTITSAPALDVAGANNSFAATIAGGSATGSGTNGVGLSITGTMNTSGLVDGAAFFANITDTAHGLNSNLFDLQVGGAAKLLVDMTGGVWLNSGGFNISTTASASINGNRSVVVSNAVYLNSAATLTWSSSTTNVTPIDLTLTRKGAANLMLGAADAAAPVAQTLSVQSVVAGTSNTAGQLWKHVGSLSTGSGLSGDMSFQTGGTGAGSTAQNTPVDALVIKGATQNIRLPAITTDAGLTDATVCEDTTNHALFFGSGTLGICLGTSSARYKHDVSDLGVGLRAIMALQPKRYFLDGRHGNPNKPYYGFLAEDGADVLPELVGNDNSGRPNTFDYLGIVPILVRAVQEQQAEIETLRRMVQ